MPSTKPTNKIISVDFHINITQKMDCWASQQKNNNSWGNPIAAKRQRSTTMLASPHCQPKPYRKPLNFQAQYVGKLWTSLIEWKFWVHLALSIGSFFVYLCQEPASAFFSPSKVLSWWWRVASPPPPRPPRLIKGSAGDAAQFLA